MGTITLKDGESKKITGLPTGITYKVTESETDSAGFTVDKTGDTGDITTTPAEAKFTNTKEEGGLTVSKSVESPAGSDKSKKFSFKVTLYGASVNGTYGDMTFINSVAEFELSDGQTATATGLAKGIEYTVDETADSNFTTESSGISGAIHEEPGTASFTNKRKTGELEVKKVLVSDAGEDQNKSFQFTIRLGDQTVSGKFGDITNSVT